MTTNESDANQSDDSTCPTCGNEYVSPKGMRQHHARTHGEKLVYTSTCEWCGDGFECRPTQDRVYCSFACRSAQRSENGLPQRKRRVELTCGNCGECFDVPRCESHYQYCSWDCFKDSTGSKDIECEWCGNDFRASGKWAEGARFCSQDCYGLWIENEQEPEDHPRWKGDEKVSRPPDYGPGWNEPKRREVRFQAGYECEDCGMSQDYHTLKKGVRLHVHHEVNPRTSTNPAVHNAPRNLSALCISCHRGRGIPE